MNELTTAYLTASLSALPLIAAALLLRRLLKSAPKLQVIQSEVRMLPDVSIAAVCRKFAELGEL